MTRRVALACAAVVAAVSASSPRSGADRTTAAGVVVEVVEKTGLASVVGIRAGDRLVAWEASSCAAADGVARRGAIASTFDVLAADREQAPGCAIRLEGWRAGVPISFTLPDYDWGLRTRPVLPPVLLARYEKEDWGALADALHATGRPRDEIWARLRLGDASVKAKRENDANAAFACCRAIARGAHDPIAEVQAWLAEGATYYKNNQPEKAGPRYAEALRTAAGVSPDSPLVAYVLYVIGSLDVVAGYADRAGPSLERSLAIQSRVAPRSLLTAKTLNMLAWVAATQGGLDRAEQLSLHALALAEARGRAGFKAAGSALGSLANVARERGDLAVAEAYFSRQLPLVEPGSLDVAIVLLNLSSVSADRGDLDAAERGARDALAIFEKQPGGRLYAAHCLEALGWILQDRGDLEASEDFLKRSLALREIQVPGSLPVARTLERLGQLARLRHDLPQARQYLERAFKVEQIAPGGAHAGNCLRDLAALARDGGDRAEAERLLKQALAIHQAVNQRTAAESLADLGQLAFERGALRSAESYHRRALAIKLKIAPGSSSLAESWHALAVVLWKQSRRAEAVAAIERALASLELQQGKLGGSEDVRAGFAAGYAEFYRDAVALLVEAGKPREAFRVLERSHARSLLALLAERDLVFADMPPALERERKSLDVAYERTQAEIAALRPEADGARIERLTGELRELANRRAGIESRVRAASPRVASLRYPVALDVEAARDALDPGTVFLSYCVGREKTFLFTVPARHEGAGADLGVIELPFGEQQLRSRIARFRGLLEAGRESPGNLGDVQEQSARLYDDLVRPAAVQLARARRLLVSPDGALHLLPFAALVTARAPARYLIETMPLHIGLSATLYAELRKTRRTVPASGSISLAAFGDPALTSTAAGPTPRTLSLTLRAGRLGRLPWSRDEVRRIADQFAPSAVAYLGAEATEERVKSLGAAPRYVHFATHGIYDWRFPLDSALVLTPPAAAAVGRENGLLQAWEIFESVRLDADLVTLSACETGLGREAGGEGLISLSRAFHYAGARSVLASLWAISDRSTPELMVRFYAGIKNGRPKDEALQAAQVEMIRGANHPFHWAAFELSGDWR